MSKPENVDEIKMADAMQPSLKFLDLYADIKGFPQTQHDLSDTLLMKRGVLPVIEIAETQSEFRTGKPATRADFDDAGVKCKRSVEKDGAQTVTVDYGNGVTISSTEGGKPTLLPDGHKVVFKNNMTVEINGKNVGKLNGNVEDEHGRILAKHNPDGSYTVDVDGKFFTQRADGTIRKETAIRVPKPGEKKFHDFEVLDVENPLGNMRPSDMTIHKK